MVSFQSPTWLEVAKEMRDVFFPERSEVFLTHADQIIAFNIPVEYSVVTIIRCKINNTIVSKNQTDFSQYIRS